jgi:hypothetical protein
MVSKKEVGSNGVDGFQEESLYQMLILVSQLL